MKFKLKNYRLYVGYVLLIILFSIVIIQLNKTYKHRLKVISSSNVKIIKMPPKIITKEVIKTPENVLLSITKDTLLNDIKKYSGISSKTKAKILTSIYKYSEKYKLNPLMVYAVIATESSFRYWIKHSLAKGAKERAIGLGGIMWLTWKKDLISNNIAEVKSDLYDIDTNVHASCYILKHNMQMPQIKGTKTIQESAFLRYFGGGIKNAWYITKVNNVLSSLMKEELYKPIEVITDKDKL